MKIKKVLWQLTILSSFVSLIESGATLAQTPAAPTSQKLGFLIGAVGEIDAVSYQTDPFSVVSPLPYSIAENGYGTGTSLGFNIEFPLSENHQHFLIIETLLDSKPADFVDISAPRRIPDTTAADEILGGYESASLEYLLLDLGYKFNFLKAVQAPDGFAIQLCMSVGMNVQAEYTKTITHYSTALGYRQQNVVEPVEGLRSMRFALRPEMLYDIPLTATIILTPEAGMDIPLTKVTNSPSWLARSSFAGLAFHVTVGQ
ncbi:MAG: hypothetical protein Q8921_15095 [Bacteroidota bacterium]|nr:hypothetical protein [Bacteroidota bacterium]